MNGLENLISYSSLSTGTQPLRPALLCPWLGISLFTVVCLSSKVFASHMLKWHNASTKCIYLIDCEC